MLVCECAIVVYFKNQQMIDILVKQGHSRPYAETLKRCSGYLDPVRAWLNDQKKDPNYLRFNVEFVHVSDQLNYKSVIIKVT